MQCDLMVMNDYDLKINCVDCSNFFYSKFFSRLTLLLRGSQDLLRFNTIFTI